MTKSIKKKQKRKRPKLDLTTGWPSLLRKATQAPGRYVAGLHGGIQIRFSYVVPHPLAGAGWDHTEWAEFFDCVMVDYLDEGEVVGTRERVLKSVLIAINNLIWLVEEEPIGTGRGISSH